MVLKHRYIVADAGGVTTLTSVLIKVGAAGDVVSAESLIDAGVVDINGSVVDKSKTFETLESFLMRVFDVTYNVIISHNGEFVVQKYSNEYTNEDGEVCKYENKGE